MNDLIDRQAAIEAVQEELNKQERSRLVNIWTTAEVRFTIVELILKQLPTAEPKTGRWKKTGAYPHKVYCSVCYATYVPNSELESWSMKKDSFWKLPRNYCPNCGAIMEGEEDGRSD